MKLDVDTIFSADAAGPGRATCAIVGEQRGPRDVVPASVAFIVQGDGRTVRLHLSTAEARGLGEMLIVCGAVADGGPPPVIARPAPPIIVHGGRA
jgi:hypothetical protein